MATFRVTTLGGMNRKLNPFDIKTSDLKLVLNYNSDVFFAKKKRHGYSTFLNNPDSLNVYNLVYFKRNDGVPIVLRNSGISLYKYAFTGSTWGSAVKTSQGSTANQKQIISNTTVAAARLNNGTTNKNAQGFKPASTTTFPYIDLLLLRLGTPGTLNVRIETDSTGSPSGTPVTNGTATITATTVGTAAGWIRATFATAPTLTSGTQYHIVVYPDTADGTNYYDWYGSADDVYSNGSAKFNSGAGYGAISGLGDFSFIVYGLAGTYLGTCVLNNLLIGGNGGDATWKYDQTTFTDIATAPRAKYWKTWKSRAYAAGLETNPSYLGYSKTNDPTSWTNDPNDNSTGSGILIDPDNNGSIVGIDLQGDRLIVHKEQMKYRIIPDEYGRPSEVMPIPGDGTSTSSNWSIVSCDSLGYYFNPNAIYEYNGGVADAKSVWVEDLVLGVSGSVINMVSAGSWQKKVYFSLGTITEDTRLGGRTYTNTVLVYDQKTSEWYLYTFSHAPTCFNTWFNASNVQRMYFGDAAGNTFMYDPTVNTDANPGGTATAISGEFEGYDQFMDYLERHKTYRSIWVFTNPGCESHIGYSLEGRQWETVGNITGKTTKKLLSGYAYNQGSIAFKVSDSSKTSSVIYGYVVTYDLESEPPSQKSLTKR